MVNRSFFLLSALFMAILTAGEVKGQDAESETVQNPEVTEPASQPELDTKNREEIWLADSKIIFDIIEPLRSFRESSSDSSVQQKKRKRQLAAALKSLNDKMIGKSLELSAVKIEDVTPEREITKFGIKKLQTLRKQIEKDPTAKAYMDALGDDWASNPLFTLTLGLYLAGCEKCFRDTGRYIAKCKISREPDNPYTVNDGIKIIRPNTADGSQEEQYGNEKMISVEIELLIPTEDQALNLQKGAVQSLKGLINSIDYEGSEYSEKVKIYLR